MRLPPEAQGSGHNARNTNRNIPEPEENRKRCKSTVLRL
jgi:hypothetical protein